jgi:hypothetical protein
MENWLRGFRKCRGPPLASRYFLVGRSRLHDAIRVATSRGGRPSGVGLFEAPHPDWYYTHAGKFTMKTAKEKERTMAEEWDDTKVYELAGIEDLVDDLTVNGLYADVRDQVEFLFEHGAEPEQILAAARQVALRGGRPADCQLTQAVKSVLAGLAKERHEDRALEEAGSWKDD